VRLRWTRRGFAFWIVAALAIADVSVAAARAAAAPSAGRLWAQTYMSSSRDAPAAMVSGEDGRMIVVTTRPTLIRGRRATS
jgi:hypothetical protein